MTYAKDAEPPFYHGTRADLAPGDLIAAGFASNYGAQNQASWVYFSGSLEAATWGAELASPEGARPRIYLVEPSGEFLDDPNLTDTKFPGNPTQSYRSRAALRVTGEVPEWQGQPGAAPAHETASGKTEGCGHRGDRLRRDLPMEKQA